MVLAPERRLAIAEKLAAVIADPRDPLRLVHRLPQILRARILAIACRQRALAWRRRRRNQRSFGSIHSCLSAWPETAR